MILVQILNCHQLTRDIAGANFNFIPCLELEVYAQKTNLCFSRTWKKITNFLFPQIGIGRVYQNILS